MTTTGTAPRDRRTPAQAPAPAPVVPAAPAAGPAVVAAPAAVAATAAKPTPRPRPQGDQGDEGGVEAELTSPAAAAMSPAEPAVDPAAEPAVDPAAEPAVDPAAEVAPAPAELDTASAPRPADTAAPTTAATTTAAAAVREDQPGDADPATHAPVVAGCRGFTALTAPITVLGFEWTPADGDSHGGCPIGLALAAEFAGVAQ